MTETYPLHDYNQYCIQKRISVNSMIQHRMVRALWCIIVALHCMMKINAVYLYCIPNLAPIYEMHCYAWCKTFYSKFCIASRISRRHIKIRRQNHSKWLYLKMNRILAMCASLYRSHSQTLVYLYLQICSNDANNYSRGVGVVYSIVGWLSWWYCCRKFETYDPLID